MHVFRLLIPAFIALWANTSAAGPLRCAEEGDGGACVWGRADGFEADSVQIRGLRVHLVGIAAPGPRDLCSNHTSKTEFPCNRPARKRMGELIAKGVACDLFDVAGDNLYGRCRVAEGDLARLLVASGVVRAVKDSPYDADQAAALSAHRGLWATDISPPKDWENLRRKAERE